MYKVCILCWFLRDKFHFILLNSKGLMPNSEFHNSITFFTDHPKWNWPMFFAIQTYQSKEDNYFRGIPWSLTKNSLIRESLSETFLWNISNSNSTWNKNFIRIKIQSRKRLDLSLQTLREVPVDDLLQLGKKLKSLDLAKNQLTSLPGKFSGLGSGFQKFYQNVCPKSFQNFTWITLIIIRWL